MPKKFCEVCGSEFHARLSRIKTCSFECRNRMISSDRQARHTTSASCVICGCQFTRTAKSPEKATCSKECSYRLRGEKTLSRVVMKCVTCDKLFDLPKHRTKSEKSGKYCSKACMYARGPAHRLAHAKTDAPASAKALGHVSAKAVLKRRTALQQATPAWATAVKIKAIYRSARDISLATGTVHHADHVVPLQSELVCGLHNEFNLMVIPAGPNLSKGNRHWPDMW